jgi:ferric-dicitrate binding protein FerR (iron transport regulator)
MSRCIREREVFTLLDGSMKPSARQRWNEHLSACRSCAGRVEALEQLKAAALDALPIAEPDWSKIDPGIERAIAEVTERRRPTLVWAPLGLAAAAAALVTLALLVARPGDDPRPTSLDRAGYEVSPQPVLAYTLPEKIECALLEGTAPTRAPCSGEAVAEGDSIATPPGGDVRIALGPESTVDIFPDSKLELVSSTAIGPMIGISKGTILVDIPAGAFERELTVLAGDTLFTVLDGSFELSVTEDGLIVAVADGELAVENGDEPKVLAAGLWQTERTSASGDDDWLKLKLAPVHSADAGIEAEDLTEREWYRPTGTLPKRVIRETLNRAKPNLKACYEMSLKRFPELEVSVTARVSVGLRGQVSRVKLRGGERWPDLERCLSTVLGQMSFPPPSGGPVDLIFPLRLSPER